MSYFREEALKDSNDAYDEGSQNWDDARSWCSQRSDSGYHSSGAYSDSREHAGSSYRSIGSVGSHESGGGLRYQHLRALAAVANLINGETHFPTAMSTLSDAQRSDIATICSGSVVDDIEVESVGDNHSQTSYAAYTGTTKKTVEFTSDIQTPVVPMSGIPAGFASRMSPAYHDGDKMGPPLSRTLLMQKADALSSSKPSSVRSFGSNNENQGAPSDGGSLDVETHSLPSQSDASTRSIDNKDSKHPGLSLLNTCESYGYSESDGGFYADTDDGCNSLDVETYSVETARSIRSQDFRSKDFPTKNTMSDPVLEEVYVNPLYHSETVQNGRRSPGGTIYRGKGVRRYQGRYMHLPLKRFHNNGIYLNSVSEVAVSHIHVNNDSMQGVIAFHDTLGTAGAIEPSLSKLDNPLQYPRDGIHLDDGHSKRYRGRSRSRSASPARMRGARARSPQYRWNTR